MPPVLLSADSDFDDAMAHATDAAVGDAFYEEILQEMYRAEDAGVKARMAQIRQARIKHASDIMHHLVADGIGTPVHKTDVETYHAWAWHFRDEHDQPDYSCWNDPGFIREWVRDNPDVRVKVDKRGDRVGWTPAMEGRVTLTDTRGNAAA